MLQHGLAKTILLRGKKRTQSQQRLSASIIQTIPTKRLMYILNQKKKKSYTSHQHLTTTIFFWSDLVSSTISTKLIEWPATLMTRFETNWSNKQSIYNYFLQPQLLSDLLLSTEMLESSVERTWGIDIPPETTISAIGELIRPHCKPNFDQEMGLGCRGGWEGGIDPLSILIFWQGGKKNILDTHLSQRTPYLKSE